MAAKDDVKAQALRVGLDLAWRKFPEDVADAMEHARQLSSRLPRSLEPKDEPWPPMHVGYRS